MENVFRKNTLERVVEQFREAKQHNLEIDGVLYHQMRLSKSKFKRPYLRSDRNGTFLQTGVSGELKETIPANSIFYQTGDIQQVGRAVNVIQCNYDLPVEDPIQRNFWRAANAAGQIVMELRPYLTESAGLWSIWQALDPPKTEMILSLIHI